MRDGQRQLCTAFWLGQEHVTRHERLLPALASTMPRSLSVAYLLTFGWRCHVTLTCSAVCGVANDNGRDGNVRIHWRA